MSNSVDPDETAHYEPSHLDLRCLQKPVIIAYGSEKVKTDFMQLNSLQEEINNCKSGMKNCSILKFHLMIYTPISTIPLFSLYIKRLHYIDLLMNVNRI